MKQLLLLLFTGILLGLFSGCNKNDEDIVSLEQEPTLEDLKSIKYATLEWFDQGWNVLTLSPTNEPGDKVSISFHVDLNEKMNIQEGTFFCNETRSFKQYSLYNKKSLPVPNNIIAIKKIDEDNYSITYAYWVGNKLFEGTYIGKIGFQLRTTNKNLLENK